MRRAAFLSLAVLACGTDPAEAPQVRITPSSGSMVLWRGDNTMVLSGSVFVEVTTSTSTSAGRLVSP